MLIEITDCAFGYANRPVIRVDRLAVDEGRCLGIFGPNGSGKTTLVRGLTGLLRPLAGVVRRDTGVRFGYLPQHRGMGLHWPMTAFDAAALPVSSLSWTGWVGRRGRLRVYESLRALGIDELRNKRFARLSGGQQQRVLLAGVLAADPNVLLLDEPTDGLDTHSRQRLLDTLRASAQRGLATVLISHDVDDVVALCHDVALVHAADEPDQPSRVELLSKEQFTRRLATAGGLR